MRSAQRVYLRQPPLRMFDINGQLQDAEPEEFVVLDADEDGAIRAINVREIGNYDTRTLNEGEFYTTAEAAKKGGRQFAIELFKKRIAELEK